MATLAALVAQACEALRRPGPLAGAEVRVAGRPGLYAVYGDAKTWKELGLGKPPDARPLYLRKAEDSLVARDLRTHFSDGRTGQSTLRRSLAALLHDTLGLSAIPRNPAKPAHFSNYGLSAAHDAALTEWMKERLQLAVWPKTHDASCPLGEIEAALLIELRPPLNLRGTVTPWTSMLKVARAAMAEEARTWQPRSR